MSAANGDMRAWLKDRGHDVNMRGRVRAELAELYYAEHPGERTPGSVALLPSPDEWEEGGYDDIGALEPDPEPVLRGPHSEPQPSGGPLRYEAVPEPPPPPSVDPGPAHGTKGWQKEAKARSAPTGGRSAPRKVSVSVRADIAAKISLPLEMLGHVWQARDPLCGGVFLDQRPAISESLTDIVCDSPDLVAWFTGGAGKYMIWFNLVMACWPVATVYGAHHIWHTIEAAPEDATQPDYGTYAA